MCIPRNVLMLPQNIYGMEEIFHGKVNTKKCTAQKFYKVVVINLFLWRQIIKLIN